MSKTGKAISLKKRIANFRLTAASVILGNLANTGLCIADMHDDYHIAELCEQYSLLLLLNWLATKYGFPVCTQSMYPDKLSVQLPLLSWASLADRYPLLVYGDPSCLAASFSSLQGLMDSSFPHSIELLGAVYQQMLACPLSLRIGGMPHIDMQSDERVGGEFYTPAWVADYAFERWLQADEKALLKRLNSKNVYLLPRISDPSCGSGNFLLAALRLADRVGLDSIWLREFAGHSIHGSDIDGRAIELAKLSIIIFLGAHINRTDQDIAATELSKLLLNLDANIQLRDSLLSAIPDKEGKRFDLVITNPPYISFGSRDQQKISLQWQKLLKQRFPASSEYKLRYTSMFQELGIEQSCLQALKHELESDCNVSAGQSEHQGQCIFFVPDAFLTGSYYQRLRNLILDRVEIEGLSEFPASTISDATVGRWCLAHYKQRQQARDTKRKVKLNSVVFHSDLGTLSSQFELPYDALVSNDRQRLQLVFTPEDLEILLLCKPLEWLGSVLRGHTGIRSKIGQARIIAADKASSFHVRGLTSGGELRPFSVDWRGAWIDLQKDNLFAGGFDPFVITGTKLFLRQTGDRLIAAVDSSGLYHLNNVHSFVPVSLDERESRIYFYACLLNSSFYLYFYRMKTREHKRALAQIDIETVEHMPLPRRNPQIEEQLQALGILLTQSQLGPERGALTERMNQLVFELFEIDHCMQDHIKTVSGSESANGQGVQMGQLN